MLPPATRPRRRLRIIPLIIRSYHTKYYYRLAAGAPAGNNLSMATYRIKVGFHNPSALTFRELDAILAEASFRAAQSQRAGVRYFTEYEYESEGDLCSVCALAYSHACKVRKCPLVLVEMQKAEAGV